MLLKKGVIDETLKQPVTVQLSSKVTFARVPEASFTCFRRVSHTFRMRPIHVPDASPSGKKGAWHSHTSCWSFIVRFCTCMDASRAHSGCILRTSQTCPACVSDAFKCYLGAELYRTYQQMFMLLHIFS